MNNLSDKSLLAAMIEDAKNYLADYILTNGESSVTVNAQKRIDAMVARYDDMKTFNNNDPRSITNYNASDVLKNGIVNFNKLYYSEYDKLGKSALLMLQLNKGGKLWMRSKTLKGCIIEAQSYLDNNKDQTGYLINNAKTVVIFMSENQDHLIGIDGNVL